MARPGNHVHRIIGCVVGAVAMAACAAPSVPRPDADPPAPITLSLPALSGGYSVASTSLHLVDPARPDPWKPELRRELMVSISYPAAPVEPGRRALWLPAAIADTVEDLTADPQFVGVPDGAVDWRAVERHAAVDQPVVDHPGGWPVVLFSPGFATWSELYATFLDDLASRGHVVVALSHTYEAPAVEFPDGRVVSGNRPGYDPVTMKTAIDARVADTRFVLDQLTRLASGANPDAEQRALPGGLAAALDLSRLGMFGHSYGGYTTAETMRRDDRIRAGADLDGTMAHGLQDLGWPYQPGEVVAQGLDRPFLLMGAASMLDPATGVRLEHNHLAGSADRTWVEFWANQRGWKRDLTLHQGAHYSFTDMQAVLPQVAAVLPAGRLEAVVGTVEPDRSVAAQRTYLDAFFALMLRGDTRRGSLFDAPSPDYPEIRLVR